MGNWECMVLFLTRPKTYCCTIKIVSGCSLVIECRMPWLAIKITCICISVIHYGSDSELANISQCKWWSTMELRVVLDCVYCSLNWFRSFRFAKLGKITDCTICELVQTKIQASLKHNHTAKMPLVLEEQDDVKISLSECSCNESIVVQIVTVIL